MHHRYVPIAPPPRGTHQPAPASRAHMSLVLHDPIDKEKEGILVTRHGLPQDTVNLVLRGEVAARKEILEIELGERKDIEFRITVARSAYRGARGGTREEKELVERRLVPIYTNDEKPLDPHSPSRPRVRRGPNIATTASRKVESEETELRHWIVRLEEKLREPIELRCIDDWKALCVLPNCAHEEQTVRSEAQDGEITKRAVILREARLTRPPVNKGPPPRRTVEEEEAYQRGQFEGQELTGRKECHEYLVLRYGVRLFSLIRTEDLERCLLEEQWAQAFTEELECLYLHCYSQPALARCLLTGMGGRPQSELMAAVVNLFRIPRPAAADSKKEEEEEPAEAEADDGGAKDDRPTAREETEEEEKEPVEKDDETKPEKSATEEENGETKDEAQPAAEEEKSPTSKPGEDQPAPATEEEKKEEEEEKKEPVQETKAKTTTEGPRKDEETKDEAQPAAEEEKSPTSKPSEDQPAPATEEEKKTAVGEEEAKEAEKRREEQAHNDKESAATKIQALLRRRQALTEVEERRLGKEKEEHERAAVKIQAQQRRRRALQKVEERRLEKEKEEQERERAATKIQAQQRRRKAEKEMAERRAQQRQKKEAEEEPPEVVEEKKEETAQDWYDRAQRLLAAEDPTNAAETAADVTSYTAAASLVRCLELNPSFAAAWQQNALHLVSSGDPTKTATISGEEYFAEGCLSKALAIQNDDLQLWVDTEKVLSANHRSSIAVGDEKFSRIDVLGKIIELASLDAHIERRGKAYFTLLTSMDPKEKVTINGTQMSLSDCGAEYVRLNPEDSKGWYCFGVSLPSNWTSSYAIEGKDYRRPIECYVEALRINPKNVFAWNGVASALPDPTADHLASEYVQFDGENINAVEAYAKMLSIMNDESSAREDSPSKDLVPEATAWYNMAVAMDAQEDPEMTVTVGGASLTITDCFLRVLIKDPERASAWFALANAMEEDATVSLPPELSNCFPREEKCSISKLDAFLKYLALEPNTADPTSWYNVGVLLNGETVTWQEKPLTDQMCFVRVCSLDPENTDGWYNLATMLEDGAKVKVGEEELSKAECMARAGEE